MSKPQSTPPGFKELEFRDDPDSLHILIATGPFGLDYKIWDDGESLEVWFCGGDVWVGSDNEDLEDAKAAANEHCHKEIGRWVR